MSVDPKVQDSIPPGAATLTALVGAMLILAAVLRLGFVANFISTPVLTGFKAGVGLVIVLDQVPKLLGVHVAKQGFFRDLFGVAQHVPETSLITLAVAVATLLVLVCMERLWPHAPAPLVAVGLNPGVLEMVRQAGLYERLGRERMLFNARAAIARYQTLEAAAGAGARRPREGTG